MIRYAAAACQTDLPNPLARAEMRANTDRMLAMIDQAAEPVVARDAEQVEALDARIKAFGERGSGKKTLDDGSADARTRDGTVDERIAMADVLKWVTDR